MNRHGRVPIWDYRGDSLRDTYKLPIHEIAKTLDETYKGAVNILIEHSQEQRSLCREEHQQKLSLFSFRLKNLGAGTRPLEQQ